MSVRLGFSVAIQADADVLLVDEVLAVGDAAFQQKCFEQFHRLKREGKTIIFVTHDMSSVERFCDRAMLMERGTVLAIDSPHAISRAYNELNFGRLTESFDPHGDRYGDHAEAEIKAAWFEGETGEHLSSLAHGETLRLAMDVTFHRPVENPAFGFHLRNEVGHTIIALSSEHIYGAAGRFEAGDDVVVRASMPNWLTPGRYTLSPAVSRGGEGSDALDIREDLASIMVHGVRFTGGILDPPCTMEVVPR
jgi:hypothetical protein